MSEGARSFSSLFSTEAPESFVDGRRASMYDRRWGSFAGDPWGAGQDLPSLLQQVSLKGRRDSEGMVPDDIRSRKRVDLFLSLRRRKSQMSCSEAKDQEGQKEIKTIFSNLRNKGWWSDS